MFSHTTNVRTPYTVHGCHSSELTRCTEISSEQTQLVINSITDAYNSEGQANPLNQNPMAGMGGMGFGPPGFPPHGFPPPGNIYPGTEAHPWNTDAF